MEISRRDFIKGGLGVLGIVIVPHGVAKALGSVRASESEIQRLESPDMATRWRFIVDTRKCIGCGRCIQACKLENDVPAGPAYNRTWVERYVMTEDDEVLIDSPASGIDGFGAGKSDTKYENLRIRKSFFVPKLCNQCRQPPCTQVCPVSATYATRDGVVLVDRRACIGCRYCIQACPYGARYLDPRFKVVDKCTWCYHRIKKGLPPACVEVCPVGARVFGDARDSSISKLLREQTMAVLKPDLGTEPSVYYIALENGVR